MLPAEHLHPMISAALERPQYQRQALAAIRYSGDIHWIDTLLERIDTHTQPAAQQAWFGDPGANLARLAANVFTHITAAPLSGSDRGPGLWMPAPEQTDDSEEDDIAANPAIPVARKQDPDDGLPWPDPMKIRLWWQQQHKRFTSATHWLAGRPLSPESAVAALIHNETTQLQRLHAAIHLRHENVTLTLFDVRAPMARQQAALAQLSSQSIRL
jgi:hypothetical protein